MRGLAATFRAALAEAAANRAALYGEVGLMVANDLVWIVFWLLFFRRVGHLRGWDVHRILLLQAVLMTAGGLSLGVLSNARRIGRMVVAGDLDGVLALPVAPLPYVLLRTIEPISLGDFVMGLLVFAFAGHPTPARAAVFVGAVAGATCLLTSFFVVTGSLAFFLGRNEGGEAGVHAMLALGAYPVDVFAGVAKLLVYTVVPAVFVSAVPARLVASFDAGLALRFVLVAAGFAIAARSTFTRGLRRYTSGAVWTRA